jgi:hypothetical protein
MLTGTVIAFISSLFFALLGFASFSSGSRGPEIICLFVMLVSAMAGVLLWQTS